MDSAWDCLFGIGLDAGQQKIRGNVNGNILTLQADERTPLINESATPELRELVSRILAAYPDELPNRISKSTRVTLGPNSGAAPPDLDTDLVSVHDDGVFQRLSPRRVIARCRSDLVGLADLRRLGGGAAGARTQHPD